MTGSVSKGDELRGLSVVVMTVSDSAARGERKDESGPAAIRLLEERGATIAGSEVVADKQGEISERLKWWIREPSVDVVLTTGGTGVAPTDVTPEATEQVCDRLIPGIGELMRSISIAKTPHAALSRALAGSAQQTLIINLPGSPGGVRDCIEAVAGLLPHAVKLIKAQPSEHLQT